MTTIADRVKDIAFSSPRMAGRRDPVYLFPREPDRRGKGNTINTDNTLRDGTYTIDPVTGCWNWNYSLINGTIPQGWKRDEQGNMKHINVRRLLWKMKKNTPLPSQIAPRCLNERCINPSHMVAGSRKRVQVINAIDHTDPTLSATEVAHAVGKTPYLTRKAMESMGRDIIRKPREADWRSLDIRDGESCPPGVRERDWEIFLAAQKRSLGDVAVSYDLTRQAVSLIAQKVAAKLAISRYHEMAMS